MIFEYKLILSIPQLETNYFSSSFISEKTYLKQRHSTVFRDYQKLHSTHSTQRTYRILQILQYKGFHPISAFFNQNTYSTHWLVSTENSIEYQLRKLQTNPQTFTLQRKGDVALSANCDYTQSEIRNVLTTIYSFSSSSE